MSFIQEFKAFAARGNVMDLAIGVIIGGAFGRIVDSVINDLIMPVVGRILGNVNFSDLYIPLRAVPDGTMATLAEMKKLGIPVIAYGSFITVAINFLILALVIFCLVKAINRLRTPDAPAAPAATPEDTILLRQIRDALKK